MLHAKIKTDPKFLWKLLNYYITLALLSMAGVPYWKNAYRNEEQRWGKSLIFFIHLLIHNLNVLLAWYLYLYKHLSNLNLNIIISYLGNPKTLVEYSFHYDLSFWLTQTQCLSKLVLDMLSYRSSSLSLPNQVITNKSITTPLWVWQVSQIKSLINVDLCREA